MRPSRFPISKGRRVQAATVLSLCSLMLCSLTLPPLAWAQQAQEPPVMTASTQAQAPLQAQIAIQGQAHVSTKNPRISLNLRDAELRDVLNILARQGGFNLILDESVEGTLTVDVKNIAINKAFEYLMLVANLSYTQDGQTIIVATKEAANTKNLNLQTFQAIPVRYRDSALVANTLNTTLFSVARAGGSPRAVAASDPDSNSILVMGTDQDIQMVKTALKRIDVPYQQRVYPIRYTDPSYVAQILAAKYFGFGQPGTAIPSMSAAGGAGGQVGAGGQAGMAQPGGAQPVGGVAPQAGGQVGGGGGGAVGAAPGGAQAAGGAAPQAGGQAGGAVGGAAGGGAPMPVPPVIFRSGGATFIADTLSATLTVIGTPEQLRLVDEHIDEVDLRRPQVAIELALVEIQNTDIKTLVPQFGGFNLGQWNLSLLPNSLTWSSTASPTGRPALASFSIQASLEKIRGKVLANPTVVALDGTSSNINITDQVPTIIQTVSSTAQGPITTSQITTQSVGISLQVTPTVTNDGSVTLNLQPSVSQPIREIIRDGASTFLLAQRSVQLSAARVMDGQTLMIGGLVREADSSSLRKVPGLSELPIVGAMFRAADSVRRDRTELVLFVTPHILPEAATSFASRIHRTPPERAEEASKGLPNGPALAAPEVSRSVPTPPSVRSRLQGLQAQVSPGR